MSDPIIKRVMRAVEDSRNIKGMICGMPKVTIDSSDAERLCRTIDQKQADLDRARARVAELEEGLCGIANCAFGYSGARQTAEEAASWMNGEAMRLIGDPQPGALILRKQAEAVDAALLHIMTAPRLSPQQAVEACADRLRRQADELEEAN